MQLFFIILFELLLFLGFSTCNAGIYLAINALAYTEDNGNGEIIKRRLEVNWYGDEVYHILCTSSKLVTLSQLKYRSQVKI